MLLGVKVVLMLAGALLVAAVVWASVAADAYGLGRDAGWWALAVLAFPAFIGFAAWRWGD